jgi:hypothetical protein
MSSATGFWTDIKYKVDVNSFSLSCDILFMDAGKRMRKKQKRQEKK